MYIVKTNQKSDAFFPDNNIKLYTVSPNIPRVDKAAAYGAEPETFHVGITSQEIMDSFEERVSERFGKQELLWWLLFFMRPDPAKA